MVDVASYSHVQSACKGLEYSFYLMMLVCTACLNVKIHVCSVAQTLEEVKEHFGRHVTYVLALKFGIPVEPWTSAEIECYLTKAIVHGQAVAVAFDAALVSEGFVEALAEGEGYVFDGVMLVDVEVACALYGEVYVAVSGYLVKHVVKEA